MADPKAPQVVFDIACPECGCDVVLPLIKIRGIKSFSGNKLQIEWPSKDTHDDFARVACPQCGLVSTVRADGTYAKSPNRLFTPFAKKAKKKAK